MGACVSSNNLNCASSALTSDSHRQCLPNPLTVFRLPASFAACSISTALDVTLSRRAEVVLAESEDRFRHVTAMTSDLFYACKRDEDGYLRIEWVGGDAQRGFGCTREELERLGCWRGYA